MTLLTRSARLLPSACTHTDNDGAKGDAAYLIEMFELEIDQLIRWGLSG